MLPVLSGEVIEGQQRVLILGQLVYGLRILGIVRNFV
jgi:hypothetical protein